METFWIKTLQFLLSITTLWLSMREDTSSSQSCSRHACHASTSSPTSKFHIWSSYDNWWRRLRGKKLITERGEDGNKKYNEEAGTEYGLGWLPIGGYCQIDGMVDETQSADDLAKKPVQPWEFRRRKRISVSSSWQAA